MSWRRASAGPRTRTAPAAVTMSVLEAKSCGAETMPELDTWPPGAVLRAEAEAGHRIRELPEEHKVLRRWCALGQKHIGQRLAGLAHEIFLKLLKAKHKVSGAAERQKTLAAQDGKRALCG